MPSMSLANSLGQVHMQGDLLPHQSCKQWAPSRRHTRTAASPRDVPTTDGSPVMLRLNLWRAVVSAGSSVFSANVTEAAEAARGGVTRLARLVESPPAGFPPGPLGDQTVALLSDPLAYLSRTFQEYGPTVGLLLGGERVVLVSGTATARQVLIDEASVFIKRGTAFFPGSSLTGNGLLVSDGEIWQRQRRLSNPAFRRTVVERYGESMVAATQQLLAGPWAAGGERDVYEDFNELTLRITLDALFGAAASSSDSKRIVTAVQRAFEHFTKRAGAGFIVPEWLPTLDNLEFGIAVQQLDSTIYGLIAERKRELGLPAKISTQPGSAVLPHEIVAPPASALPHHSSHVPHLESKGSNGDGSSYARGAINSSNNDVDSSRYGSSSTGSSRPGTLTNKGGGANLLDNLLLSKDEDGTGMSDSALRDELMTLLVAGQETSAILLGWATALLASHPEVQEAVALEVTTQLQGRNPTAADVRGLTQLEAVVLEALRLYSPAYMVGRCACRDAALVDGGYSLPSGTTVLVSPYIMQRDSAAWLSPQDFQPKRWTGFQSEPGYGGFMSLMSGLGPNGSYLPFGAGPRNCIGTGFAMMEAMLVLAAVLQQYKLSPPQSGLPNRPAFPTPKPLLTLRPESVWVNLTRR